MSAIERIDADTHIVSVECPFGAQPCSALIEVEHGPHGAWTLNASECPGCLRQFDTPFEVKEILEAAELVWDQAERWGDPAITGVAA